MEEGGAEGAKGEVEEEEEEAEGGATAAAAEVDLQAAEAVVGAAVEEGEKGGGEEEGAAAEAGYEKSRMKMEKKNLISLSLFASFFYALPLSLSLSPFLSPLSRAHVVNFDTE